MLLVSECGSDICTISYNQGKLVLNVNQPAMRMELAREATVHTSAKQLNFIGFF
jgi:hypothetical protein